VRIYITGAIVKPDVYFLPLGTIVKDAIQAAGGLTEDVDLEKFNQALELKDQQHIHIPRVGEQDAPPVIQDGASQNGSSLPAENSLVNLNTASLEELDTLPGIGPAIAQRIINYRESYGNFKAIEEIVNVSGIGEVTFTKIKHLITVE
jgi:competence protein ComEA